MQLTLPSVRFRWIAVFSVAIACCQFSSAEPIAVAPAGDSSFPFHGSVVQVMHSAGSHLHVELQTVNLSNPHMVEIEGQRFLAGMIEEDKTGARKPPHVGRPMFIRFNRVDSIVLVTADQENLPSDDASP